MEDRFGSDGDANMHIKVVRRRMFQTSLGIFHPKQKTLSKTTACNSRQKNFEFPPKRLPTIPQVPVEWSQLIRSRSHAISDGITSMNPKKVAVEVIGATGGS